MPHPHLRIVPMVSALVALLATGCLPAIAHGPQVADGWSVGGTASASTLRGSSDAGLGDALFAPIGVNGGYGWRAEDPSRPSVRVGVHIPVMVYVLPQVDVYVQAPRSWLGPVQAGVGTSISAFAGASYVQLGRIRADGAGWHLTQAWIDGYDADMSPRWMTMAAWQFPVRGDVGMQTFVAAGPATRIADYLCDDHACEARRRSSAFVIAGLTFEKRFPRDGARR